MELALVVRDELARWNLAAHQFRKVFLRNVKHWVQPASALDGVSKQRLFDVVLAQLSMDSHPGMPRTEVDLRGGVVRVLGEVGPKSVKRNLMMGVRLEKGLALDAVVGGLSVLFAEIFVLGLEQELLLLSRLLLRQVADHQQLAETARGSVLLSACLMVCALVDCRSNTTNLRKRGASSLLRISVARFSALRRASRGSIVADRCTLVLDAQVLCELIPVKWNERNLCLLDAALHCFEFAVLRVAEYRLVGGEGFGSPLRKRLAAFQIGSGISGVLLLVPLLAVSCLLLAPRRHLLHQRILAALVVGPVTTVDHSGSSMIRHLTLEDDLLMAVCSA